MTRPTTMKHLAAALLLTVAVSASAETIAFHVKLTDARTALLANPNFADLKMSEERLERAKNDRVLMLDKTEGTKWTWLMLSWPWKLASVEHGLNVAGAGAVDKDAAFSLKTIDDHTVEVRCLREKCVLNETVTLKKNQKHTIAYDSDVKIEFP